MIANDGFVPISAIFYAVFHPIQGTKIVHQVPEGSIGSASDPHQLPNVLFNFDTVKNYIIPKPQLCNKPVSFKINDVRVLGYPINIEASSYSRNSFNFNFGFVLPYNSDSIPYESAVARMGKMFRALEEQLHLLSKLDKDQIFFNKNDAGKDACDKQEAQTDKYEYASEDKAPEHGKKKSLWRTDTLDYTPGHGRIQKILLSSIESLIHQIYQDLNNYSECCIPIDSANSVDIKLFPMLPPPINLKAYQVPMLTVKLDLLMDVIWDPTMVKILPHINGLNSLRKISELADADYLLTKQCIQHLMHYQCILLVDIFQFNNIYAPTNHIGNFLRTMAEDCQAYIASGNLSDNSSLVSSISHTPLQSVTNLAAPESMSGTPRSPQKTYLNSLTLRAPQLTALDNLSGKLAGGTAIPTQKNSGGILPPSTKQTKPYSNSTSPLTKASIKGNRSEPIQVPSKATLFYLYRLLNQGQTIKEWYIQHQKTLKNIDIRRFINFGVVRGIIYRVNMYPILNGVTRSMEADEREDAESLLARLQNNTKAKKDHAGESLKDRHATSMTSEEPRKKTRSVSFNHLVENPKHKNGNSLHMTVFDSSSASEDEILEEDTLEDADNHENSQHEQQQLLKLIKLVRGTQHFDSICTELQMPRTDVDKLLDKIGPHSIINK